MSRRADRRALSRHGIDGATEERAPGQGATARRDHDEGLHLAATALPLRRLAVDRQRRLWHHLVQPQMKLRHRVGLGNAFQSMLEAWQSVLTADLVTQHVELDLVRLRALAVRAGELVEPPLDRAEPEIIEMI